MIVYFYIDELSRDAITAYRLYKKLKKKKYKIFYGCRTNVKFLRYFHNLFDVIIFPQISFLNVNFGDQWIKWKEKIVCLGNENIGSVTNNKKIFSEKILRPEFFRGIRKKVERIDLFLHWGKKQYDIINMSCGSLKKKSFVVGHPRYDSFLGEKKKEKKRKIIVAILVRSPMINDYYGRPTLIWYKDLIRDLNDTNNSISLKKNFFEAERIISIKIDVKEHLIHSAVEADNILKIIYKLSNINKIKVIVRPHPKENYLTWKNLLNDFPKKITMTSSSSSVIDLFRKVDYIITTPSTVIYDSVVFGVTPISLSKFGDSNRHPRSKDSEEHNSLSKFVYKPKKMKDLIRYVKSGKVFKINSSVKKILKNDADFPECNTSIDKIIFQLERLVAKKKKN